MRVYLVFWGIVTGTDMGVPAEGSFFFCGIPWKSSTDGGVGEAIPRIHYILSVFLPYESTEIDSTLPYLLGASKILTRLATRPLFYNPTTANGQHQRMKTNELDDDADIHLEERVYQEQTTTTTSHTGITPRRSSVPTVLAGPYRYIKLNLDGRTFVGNDDTAALLREVGGGDAIKRLTNLFYPKCFEDAHINKFIQNTNDPHAERLANWIIEKMGGEGKVWTEERRVRSKCPVHVTLGDGSDHVVHDRSSAHYAAWFSPKRPQSEMGQRFKLDDARVWMRLMFWSARECGLFPSTKDSTHPTKTFEDWYHQFIAHFMNIYEHSAVAYVKESSAWSLSEANIQAYLSAGRRMEFLRTP